MLAGFRERLIASIFAVMGYHWYPGCGHHTSEEISETQFRRMRRRGWDGRTCPLCFGPKNPVCHWCRRELEVGSQVTAGVIPVELPETEFGPLVIDGEVPVVWLGNNVLVIFDQGNRRVGCSCSDCQEKHGSRVAVGVLAPGGKVNSL